MHKRIIEPWLLFYNRLGREIVVNDNLRHGNDLYQMKHAQCKSPKTNNAYEPLKIPHKVQWREAEDYKCKPSKYFPANVRHVIVV